jgi:thymidine phosphorylase
MVLPTEVGITKDIREKYRIKEGDLIKFTFASRAPSLKAIYKKLFGEKLTYNEMLSIINDILDHRLNDIEIAFFIASAFDEDNFTDEELSFLTKAIAQTGDMIKFEKITADKHSTGGLPGNRVTPIIVPIVASFGICIPKTSSRSITSAAGTADAVETIMNVKFNAEEIKNIVKKNKGCLV